MAAGRRRDHVHRRRARRRRVGVALSLRVIQAGANGFLGPGNVLQLQGPGQWEIAAMIVRVKQGGGGELAQVGLAADQVRMPAGREDRGEHDADQQPDDADDDKKLHEREAARAGWAGRGAARAFLRHLPHMS